MDNAGNKRPFKGADRSDYTKFEFFWIETMLARGVVQKKDLIELCEKFNIRFSGEHWQEIVSENEIGSVLINDIPKEKLLPEVMAVFGNRYPYRLNFKESEKLYGELMDIIEKGMSDIRLAKAKVFAIYKKITSSDMGARMEFIEKNILPNEEKNHKYLIEFILEEAMKKDKKEIVKLLEEVR